MPRVTPDPDRDLLLVVDVQNDFCPGGALAVSGGDDVVPAINALSRRFDHVVLTQDWHPPGHSSFASSHAGRAPMEVVAMEYGDQVLWPDHCVRETDGAEFHEGLETGGAEMIVRKGCRHDVDSYSAFFENDRRTPTGLAGYLRERGLGRLFLTGIATDFCVAWSALDARKEGFEVVLVEDACRAIDVDGSLADALERMAAAGVAIARSGDVSGN